MTEVQASLNNFVKQIAGCRNMMRAELGEATPPISVSTSLSEAAASRGMEHLYIPFDNINHTHKYKGKLGHCYQEAFRLAESDSIFIYCEGYASSEKLVIPLQHAWCVNRETKEVYDPVWNTKRVKGNAYCGIPFNLKFAIDVVLHNKQYGVIDSLWMCKHLFNTPLSDIVHPDYHSLIL
jgi:hypothetical protein